MAGVSRGKIVPKAKPRGISHDALFGNGQDAVGVNALVLAKQINMIAGNRKRCLFARSAKGGDSVGVTGDTTVFRGVFRTTPNTEYVRVAIVGMPADSTDATKDPYLTVSLGGDPIYVGRRSSSSSVVPDDLFMFEKRIAVDADTIYAFSIARHDYARVLSCTVFEEPVANLTIDADDLTADTAVAPELYMPGAPITDASLDDLWDTAYKLWKKQGAQIASWGAINNAGEKTTTSTSYVNMFTASYTDWDAGAPGFWFHPYKRGTLSSTNVPIAIRVNAKDTNSAGSIVFRTAAGVDLATISVNNTSATDFTTTANLTSSDTACKIDVLFKTTGVQTCTIYDLGIWEYSS